MMTVTPRYRAYADVPDTGLIVPLKLPVYSDHDHAVAAAHVEHQHSDDQFCQQPKLSHKAPLQAWAALYHCRQKGVDRVFVDHPLFLESCGKDTANTYLEGGSQLPDVDLQYSILCQAALAAPILLWHQPQDHLHRQQLQAQARKLPQTLCGGVAQYIGLDAASAALLAPQDSWLTSTDRPAWSSCADVRSPTEAGPAMLIGGNAHSVPPRRPCPGAPFAHSLLSQDQEMTNFDSAGIIWPESAGDIAFVGNDWPCFPLAQHLHRLQSIACESDRGLHAQTGRDNPQASASAACSAANNFEAHMARLLKSARVAFCIHNLAYQGIFAQVGVLLHCLLQHTTQVAVSFLPMCSMHQPSIPCSTVCFTYTCPWFQWIIANQLQYRSSSFEITDVFAYCRTPLSAFACLLLHCPAYSFQLPTVIKHPIWLFSPAGRSPRVHFQRQQALLINQAMGVLAVRANLIRCAQRSMS